MKKISKILGSLAVIAASLFSIVGCSGGGSSHTHTLERQKAVAATCTKTGTEQYYLCTDPECNKMFSDMNGENEIYAPVVTEKKDHALVETKAEASTCIEHGHEAYFTCSSCRKMFSDSDATNEIKSPVELELAPHSVVKVEAKPATETTSGNKEYWSCSDCKKLYSDAEGKNETSLSEVYIAPTSGLSWRPMKDRLTSTVSPVYENGVTTFTGLNSSSYLENVFVAENGHSLSGAYDTTTANTEYTYTLNVASTGTFALVLFAGENTKTTYDDADVVDNAAAKLGFFIRFDSLDSEVKIQAALGNGTASRPAETKIKAKAPSTFVFDGVTENTIQVVMERYSVDKIILHIWINGEEMFFTKTDNKTVDYCGFNFRTEWNREDLVNGIGSSYYKTGTSYSNISCSRGLSETEGYGNGLGVSVIGRLEEDNTIATGKVRDTDEDVVVKVSNVVGLKTGEQVVA